MNSVSEVTQPTGSAKRRRGVWAWIGLSSLIAFVTFLIVAEIMIERAGPILKGRVIETLSTRFNSRVELEQFNVSVLRGLEISGDQLRIFPPDAVVAAGAKEPLIAIDHFSFHSGILGLIFKPTHVRAVYVRGLHISIPPREVRQKNAGNESRKGKIKILVNKIVCEDSRLTIETIRPDKDPKEFTLKHIELHDVGPNAPWSYEAILTNAVPTGEIQAKGFFGPWNTDMPGDSSVSGHYTFDHADLNTIKGIGGILSSVGDFKGQLNKIEVDGTAETPEFSLDTSNHPVPLHTEFHAIVDGTSGDTYLQPVKAKLGESRFTTNGAVVNVKGKGHTIDLDVDIPAGQLRDFLQLAVKTEPPVMTAVIATKTKLHIRPGKESVTKRLSFTGAFALRKIRFTNPKVQDKVDMLSLRARGDPKEAKTGAKDVDSQMKGSFVMDRSIIRFRSLDYTLPGARIDLAGIYSMDGQQFNFTGTVFTKATLPHMVASRWKSLLLRPISPFFKGPNGGAEIPVKISGTKSAPKFGLDLFRKDSEGPNSKPRPR
ncbi:MAG: hypothetical protein ACJ74Y_09490 [Bryobacteraceae bacterium]